MKASKMSDIGQMRPDVLKMHWSHGKIYKEENVRDSMILSGDLVVAGRFYFLGGVLWTIA